jgi:hypothetical protein
MTVVKNNTRANVDRWITTVILDIVSCCSRKDKFKVTNADDTIRQGSFVNIFEFYVTNGTIKIIVVANALYLTNVADILVVSTGGRICIGNGALFVKDDIRSDDNSTVTVQRIDEICTGTSG